MQQQQVRNPDIARASRHGGFTLVEVMISVALVLVLIIGVNQVFKITADTASSGQVMSANIRDTRAAQAVFHGDLGAATQNPPMFIIAASRVSAFRNANDKAIDRDYNPGDTVANQELQIRTIDLNNDNGENNPPTAGELIPPAIYNHRSHRIDRLAFFSRDLYRRQTANDGAYANATGSSEAWIWYGHLRLANSSGATPVYFQPGQFDVTGAKNDNNAYGAQLALGRMVMLLKDPNTFPPAEEHIERAPAIPAPPATAGPNPTLSPLSWESLRSDQASEPSAPDKPIWASRYDLAATTIAQFQTDLTAVAPGQAHWWQRFIYAIPTGPTAVATPPAIGALPVDYRFRANRYFTKPLDSKKAAELAPILLNGCSQFIVEFAGDYVTQAPDGTVAVGSGPDGTTDFVVDNQGGTANIRSVRWYGMPRDVASSTPGISGPDGVIDVGPTSVDVIPVRDVRGGGTPSIFERNITTEMVAPGSNDYANLGDGMAPNARYTCVWGPDVDLTLNPLPQMIRLTVVLDDPNGRLAEGQQYEYVIELPY